MNAISELPLTRLLYHSMASKLLRICESTIIRMGLSTPQTFSSPDLGRDCFTHNTQNSLILMFANALLPEC